MRCISPHERYSVQVIEADEQVGMDARGFFHTIMLKKPVIANFDKTGLLDSEQEAGLMAFDFSGLPDGVNPLTRISVFDTELYVEQNYPEEQRDDMLVQIDKRLRELEHTLCQGEFIVVEHPAAERPWPRYDDYDPEEILRFQEALGVSPQTIRLYELENQGRSEIIESMLDLEDPERVKARLEEASAEAHATGEGVQFEQEAKEEGEITVQA